MFKGMKIERVDYMKQQRDEQNRQQTITERRDTERV